MIKEYKSLRKPMVIPSEHQEQVTFVEYAERITIYRYNIGDHLFAIPNGGKRNKVTAVMMKKEGVKAGVPDLMVAIPASTFAGLWIEMKALDGVVKKSQREWHERLSKVGYMVAVCWGADAAIAALNEYCLEGFRNYGGIQ